MYHIQQASIRGFRVFQPYCEAKQNITDHKLRLNGGTVQKKIIKSQQEADDITMINDDIDD